jgi:hypothetical protein
MYPTYLLLHVYLVQIICKPNSPRATKWNLDPIIPQTPNLLKNYKIQLEVLGITNSREMVLGKDVPINLDDWQDRLLSEVGRGNEEGKRQGAALLHALPMRSLYIPAMQLPYSPSCAHAHHSLCLLRTGHRCLSGPAHRTPQGRHTPTQGRDRYYCQLICPTILPPLAGAGGLLCMV